MSALPDFDTPLLHRPADQVLRITMNRPRPERQRPHRFPASIETGCKRANANALSP